MPEVTPAAAIVSGFLTALENGDLDAASAFLDENVEYQNVPLPVDHGKAATIATLKRFLLLADKFAVRMHNMTENRGVVLTERTDILSGPGVHLEFWVCGTFVVQNGRITVWRDYFDMLTVLGQVAKSAPGIASALVRAVFQR